VAATRGIFMEFYIWLFLENLLRKLICHWHVTTIMSTLHEGRLMYICGNLWLISPLSEKCFRQTLYRKSKHIFFTMTFSFFFSKIMMFMRWFGKIQYNRMSHRWQYDACTIYAGYFTRTSPVFLQFANSCSC